MSERQIVLVAVNEIPHIYWDAEKAKRLKALLPEETRESVASTLKSRGFQCTRQNIDRLFTGKARWASTSLIISICQAYSLKLSDLVDAYVVTFTEKDAKES